MENLGAGKKILVVDDEPSVADSLAAILKLNGYSVRTCYSGEMAVKTAAEFVPDAIICDVLIPDFDGIRAAKAIRAMLPQCRVLLISGRPDAIRVLEASGQPFELLMKPFQAVDVLARLQAFAII